MKMIGRIAMDRVVSEIRHTASGNLIVEMSNEEWDLVKELTDPTCGVDPVLERRHVDAWRAMKHGMEAAAEAMGMNLEPKKPEPLKAMAAQGHRPSSTSGEDSYRCIDCNFTLDARGLTLGQAFAAIRDSKECGK